MLRSALVLVLLIGWAPPSRAQPAEEAVRFQYAAPPECPDADAFTARVRERTARGRSAQPGELARTFNVDVVADSAGFAGKIDFLDDGGVKVNRQLHGEQCDAVVSSLALITALALDATLREEDAQPSADEPRAIDQAPMTIAPPLAGTPPADMKAPRAPARESTLLHARVGVDGSLSTVLTSPNGDSWSTRVGLLGQLEWRSGVALRLSAHLDTLAFTVDEGRRASLRILAVETSLCPWVLRSEGFSFYPCGVVDLGSLRAEGELGGKLTTAGGETIVWASVGAEARVLFDFSTLPVWLQLSGNAGFPLRATHQFRFLNPTAVVYEVPWLTVAGGGALGVRFW